MTDRQNETSEIIYSVPYCRLNSNQRNVIDKIIERKIKERLKIN